MQMQFVDHASLCFVGSVSDSFLNNSVWWCCLSAVALIKLFPVPLASGQVT